MKITLNNAAKRFNFEWIFKSLSYTFSPENSYAITGSNGSGKTTLISILTGYSSLSEGSILFFDTHNSEIKRDDVYQKVSISSPASALIDELTLVEHIEFHSQFKPFINHLSANEIVEILELKNHQHKFLSQYSTGMKQRVKLALAILSDVELILLDEPTANLDAAAITWFHQLLKKYAGNRLLIIASNEPEDLVHCNVVVDMKQYKV